MSLAQKSTVLVVEDELTVRELAVSIIENCGYTALSAANAREAIALLETERPIEILFADINIPDGPEALDGLGLGRAAREFCPGLRVLYTTGGAKTDGMIAFFVVGAGFLQKPYTRDRLINALDALTAA